MRKDIIHSNLPDVFKFDDGTRVTDVKSWEKRRKEIIDTALELEYGGMPPKPDKMWVEDLTHMEFWGIYSYRIHCEVKDKDFTFTFNVFLPSNEKDKKYPVIVSGDMLYVWCLNDEVMKEAHSRGFAVVKFNRNELAHDMYYEDDNLRRKGGIYELFPNSKFCAISAWAWGYHRVIDALVDLPFIEKEHISIAGHSRGGKTTMLASATDERIFATNSNGSGAHGCGCYRFEQREEPDIYTIERSETMADLFRQFPHWMPRDLEVLKDKAHELFYDQHFFKALIAPRGLFETNAYGDIWANPRGSYLTHIASREVWKLYGLEENTGYFYRPGGHVHSLEDFTAYFDFLEGMLGRKPKYKSKVPYDDIFPIHDWTAPKK